MTREDLLQLIARAVRRSFTFASDGQAIGAADTVLRDLKAAGIRLIARPTRRSEGAQPETRPRELGTAGATGRTRPAGGED